MKKLFLLIFLLGISTILSAQTAIQPAGSGTEADPYRVASLENLFWITANTTRWDYHYIQTADIDASPTVDWYGGTGWLQIGYSMSYAFTGSYDGSGFVIDNLFFNRPSEDFAGLFGFVYNGIVKNLGVTNVNITGKSYVGGLAGRATQISEISNCYSTGTVIGLEDYVGGLAGIVNYATDVLNCSSMADTQGNDYVGGLTGGAFYGVNVHSSRSGGNVTGESGIGGLVGCVLDSSISDSFSTSNVNGAGKVGGLTGWIESSDLFRSYSKGDISASSTQGGGLAGYVYDCSVQNSYSTGNVYSDLYAGGFAAYVILSTVSNSFSTGSASGNAIGGFIGFSEFSDIYNCYWDKNTSGNDTSSYGGEGRTTGEMTYPYASDAFIGWDFINVWEADVYYEMNSGYPYLRWQTTPVYRFFNHVRGGHLYTISEIERDVVMALPDWNYEGPKFNVYTAQAPGSLPAYRFFNTITGIHLYTISEIERDVVMALPEWNYEGEKFFVDDTQKPGTIAVYRFFNHVRGGHLYTISEIERDVVMTLPDWTYEGIAFYVFPHLLEFGL